jgi:hypothetical protein
LKLCNIWYTEIEKRFPDIFNVYLFYGHVGLGGTSDLVKCSKTLSPRKKLEEKV